MKNIFAVIDEKKINALLARTRKPSAAALKTVLDHALEKKGLGLEETALLLKVEDPAQIRRIFKAASKVKKEIYGERLVFFAPLYVSSYCVNDCEYCAFHSRNLMPRKKLSLDEVREQTRRLVRMGHKRLLLEFGEHPVKSPIDYAVDVIKAIYATRDGNGEIRRLNVNLAATTVDNYRKLKKAGIGTYQLFQETYHRKTYERLHRGPKADYSRQLFAHDNAFNAGIDDVGLGVLFGLYDYRFEVLALLSHAKYLEKKFGVGPHTISVPRFRPAESVTFKPGHPVTDKQMLKLIAILRLAVPYTGMIISTRESKELRKKAFEIGISQTSAGSRTSPGGYGKKEDLKQFRISDVRGLDEVVAGVLKQGLLPSFCTACYRKGRTGETFMDLAKPGNIQNLCRPNGILTFMEYVQDYASPAVRKKGLQVIAHYLARIPDKATMAETARRLERIKKGERDLYF